MDRTELEKYIRNNYGTEPDHPWIKHPNYVVFRHSSNKKWFVGCGWKQKRAVNHMKIHGSFVREHIETPSDNDKRCR